MKAITNPKSAGRTERITGISLNGTRFILTQNSDGVNRLEWQHEDSSVGIPLKDGIDLPTLARTIKKTGSIPQGYSAI